jgi:hypothetical protein
MVDTPSVSRKKEMFDSQFHRRCYCNISMCRRPRVKSEKCKSKKKNSQKWATKMRKTFSKKVKVLVKGLFCREISLLARHTS